MNHNHNRAQPLRGSISVQLTSCLFYLDSSAFLMFNEEQFYLFGQIQTSQTEGQLYSDTSLYSECCRLIQPNLT